MSQFKDAYEAGRRAVNKDPKPQLFTWMAVGAAMIAIFAPYLHANTLQTVIALLAWLLFAGTWGHRQSKRAADERGLEGRSRDKSDLYHSNHPAHLIELKDCSTLSL